MSRGWSVQGRDDLFVTLLGEDGNPPCDPPDDCTVCVLFTNQQPGETRAAWLARITGYPDRTYRLEAS